MIFKTIGGIVLAELLALPISIKIAKLINNSEETVENKTSKNSNPVAQASSSNANGMLEIKNISKTFNTGTINEKRALKNVSLTLDEGDFVTVIGGNGAGKSTLLNAICGTWLVDEGEIVIDGKDVTSMPEHKRAALLGRVFQDPMMGTAADMEIQENLALAKRRGKMRGLGWGISKKERE